MEFGARGIVPPFPPRYAADAAHLLLQKQSRDVASKRKC